MAQIIPFPGGSSWEERLVCEVHKRAQTSDNIIFSYHARDRMDKRDISDADVLRILRNGDLRGEIKQGQGENEWKLKIVYLLRETREAGVVAIVYLNSTKLLAVTVEWEDI